MVRMILSVALGLILIGYSAWRAADMGEITATVVVFGLIGLLLLVLGVVAARQFPVAQELDREGVTAKGTIIGKWTRSDDEDRRDCYVAYQFGDGYAARQQVPLSVYRRLTPGDPVEIRFLRRDPSFSRMVIDHIR